MPHSVHILPTQCAHTELKDLLRELQEVTEWQPLGQHLGLKTSDLDAIFEDNQTTDDCRREMLMLWMERDIECSWKKVTDALVRMEAVSLASQIARKYGNLLHEQSFKEGVKKESNLFKFNFINPP